MQLVKSVSGIIHARTSEHKKHNSERVPDCHTTLKSDHTIRQRHSSCAGLPHFSPVRVMLSLHTHLIQRYCHLPAVQLRHEHFTFSEANLLFPLPARLISKAYSTCHLPCLDGICCHFCLLVYPPPIYQFLSCSL